MAKFFDIANEKTLIFPPVDSPGIFSLLPIMRSAVPVTKPLKSSFKK